MSAGGLSSTALHVFNKMPGAEGYICRIIPWDLCGTAGTLETNIRNNHHK